jgi:hypothetical protein
MEILQQIGASGLPGIVVAIISTIIGVIYAINSSKSKAEQITKDSYDKAIKQQKIYEDILEKRLKDAEEESRKLRNMQEALFEALKSRDIYITISGHTISIREGKETTAIRISDEPA